MNITAPQTTTNGSAARVSWTDSEVNHIAQAFLYERESDPIGNAIEMLRRAIQKTVDAGHARFRDINTFAACPDVKARIEHLWLEKMATLNPEPQIVHVETQQPPDYIDMLHRCDLPSLVALVVAKMQDQLGTLKPLLNAFTPANSQPVGAPLQAPVSLLAAASAKPRKTRVLIAGPHNQQFREIEKQVLDLNLPVELLYFDKERNAGKIHINTDYVIANEFIDHEMTRKFSEGCPKGRYFYLTSGGIGAMVNKLRDIGSLLPPRA